MNNEDVIFEIIDKSKRKIQLLKDALKHITSDHPELSNYLYYIEDTLRAQQRLLNIVTMKVLDIIIDIIKIENQKRNIF